MLSYQVPLRIHRYSIPGHLRANHIFTVTRSPQDEPHIYSYFIPGHLKTNHTFTRYSVPGHLRMNHTFTVILYQVDTKITKSQVKCCPTVLDKTKLTAANKTMSKQTITSTFQYDISTTQKTTTKHPLSPHPPKTTTKGQQYV